MNAARVVWLAMHNGQLHTDSNGNYDHQKQPQNAAVFLPVGQQRNSEWPLAVLTQTHTNNVLSLRNLLGVVEEVEFALLSRASQLAHWWHYHRYCGCCGNLNTRHDKELALICLQCQAIFYPRISPCIIVLVAKERQCLLAKHCRSRTPRYSALAGFIEVGESAEQAVIREVAEEVGVVVNNLRYVTSQSWPFPSQLMLGFFADYASGDIVEDGEEIEHAAWFGEDALPEIPPKGTISRHLIDAFFER